MRALVIPAEGNLPEIQQVDSPRPKQGEALVRVSAAGLNYADTMMRRGMYLQKTEFPLTPGLEFCGQVVEVGDGVTGVRPGDRVMGFGSKAFAELVATPAAGLMPVPQGFSDEEAAAFPVTYLTAWGMLRISAHARAGETILIHAAAGGVGTAAIQLAKHLSLRVIATASSEKKLEIARRAGADAACLYNQPDFVKFVMESTGGRGADIVFESIGGDFPARDISCAAPFARIVVFGAASGERSQPDVATLFRNSVSLCAFWLFTLAMNRALLAPLVTELLEAVVQARIRPIIGGVYSLEEAPDVFLAMEQRRTTGKQVLKP